MGITLWLLRGVASFVASRAIAAGRTDRRTGEVVAAVVVAFVAGVAATALDFGGWNELDWRAGVFAILCAFAAVGCVRVVRLGARAA